MRAFRRFFALFLVLGVAAAALASPQATEAATGSWQNTTPSGARTFVQLDLGTGNSASHIAPSVTGTTSFDVPGYLSWILDKLGMSGSYSQELDGTATGGVTISCLQTGGIPCRSDGQKIHSLLFQGERFAFGADGAANAGSFRGVAHVTPLSAAADISYIVSGIVLDKVTGGALKGVDAAIANAAGAAIRDMSITLAYEAGPLADAVCSGDLGRIVAELGYLKDRVGQIYQSFISSAAQGSFWAWTKGKAEANKCSGFIVGFVCGIAGNIGDFVSSAVDVGGIATWALSFGGRITSGADADAFTFSWTPAAPTTTPNATTSPRPSPSRTASASPSATGKRQLVDGSFEDPIIGSPWQHFYSGKLGAWTVVGHGADIHRAPDYQAAKGRQSIDLIADQAPGGVRQDVALPPGHYDLLFALAGNPDSNCGVAQKLMHVEIDGARVKAFTFDTTGHTGQAMGWVRKSVPFSAVRPNTSIAFVSDGPEGTCGAMIDDVAIVPASS